MKPVLAVGAVVFEASAQRRLPERQASPEAETTERSSDGVPIKPPADFAQDSTLRKERRVLLIRRGKPPFEGAWSLPGGRVEFRETLEAAVIREIFEETGVVLETPRPLRWVELLGDDHHYVVLNFWGLGACEPASGSDAAEARWVSRDELREYDLTAAVLATIEGAYAQSQDSGLRA